MHELGVRVALGAQARDLLRLVVRQGMTLTLVGVAVGGAIAFVAGGQVQPLLFETQARDLRVYAVVVMVLLLAAFVATLVPALKASRADPNVALRAD
jgi:ABC-type antimicrobial peptide transport system permease subunit